MRQLLVCLTIAMAFAVPAGRAAQDPPPPSQTFQSGIDLITLDVAVLDRQGRPVGDLRKADFTVKVDGRARDVVSAELVTVDRSTAEPPPAAPTDPLITSNAVSANARRVVIAVDQTLIVPGSITALLGTASGFVDALTPQDYVALLAFPEPGPRVDFTTDRSRVRQAMRTIVGQPPHLVTRTFNPALTESVAIHEKERVFLDLRGNTPEVWRSVGPWTRRVLERGTCHQLTIEQLLLPENLEILKDCLRELGTEAMVHTLEARQEANISVRRLESYLAELVPIEGPKSMVLISAGLVIEDLTVLNEVARLAAAARTSIHVIAVDPERDKAETITGFAHNQSSLALQDRQLELTGLETVADRTGGTFVRASGGNGTGIFERLQTELSAWYVVAVERQRGDPDRQRVEVEVRRRGVQVRSNRTFVATSAINASRPPTEVLNEALSSPMAISGVPLRVSTFVQRDPAGGKYRLHVAAQIGQPGTPAGEFSVGYALMDDDSRLVASLGRRLNLAPAGGPDRPLQFDTALAVDPGVYSLRFGVVDAQGRRGTVVRRVDLGALASSALTTSDLIVGNVPPEGEAMHPSVEPHIDGGRVAGYLELYRAADDAGELTVSFEIAEGEASPALTTSLLNIGAGAQADWRVASGAIDAALLPGRYLARATVRLDGEVVRVVSRPFVLERNESAVARPAERVRAAEVSPEMRRRTAAYVANVVGSLSNVVAQEDFVLTDPDRRVTSDFLLVRYPGSERDLLTYRDVIRVNGSDLANRPERLTELFLKPMTSVRGRVMEITLAAAGHVPPVLNPMFVLAFLQPDFQSRFELTAQDAGSEWPRGVRVVAFEETARPTLLRAGPLGDLDVPSRGRAWIEEGTGRILQTELQVGSGRSATTVVTRFKLDQRLQIMVPELMRTQDPAGVATYSNFRRFSVATSTEIANEP